MDPLLNSNASSAMNSILKDVDTQRNPFSYRYAAKNGDSLSGISRTMQVVQPVNTVGANTAVDFHIPKQGLLTGMHVIFKKTFTSASGTTDTDATRTFSTSGVAFPLQKLITRIQLISQGRILSDLTGEALAALAASQPKNSRDVLVKMMNLDFSSDVVPQGNTTDPKSVTYVSRVPCLFSQTEALEKVYDTLFTAPLICRVHLGAGGFTVGSKLTAGADNLELLCDFVREDSEMHQARLSKDYSSGALQRIQWATEHLTDSAADIAEKASRSFEIKTNNFISDIMVYVSGSADTYSKAELDSLKIEANGQTICDLEANAELLKHYQPSDDWEYGASANAADSNASLAVNNVYRYNFGLSSDSRRVFGGVASRELSNFKVTVKPTAAVTKGQVHVICKYYVIESIEAASGKISQSISS